MPVHERRIDLAALEARQTVAALAAEARRTRRAPGLSQAEVGLAIRVSRETISRFERGATLDPGYLFLVRLFRVLGLKLTTRAFPDGSPRRDAAQAHVLDAFAKELAPSVGWRTEVPFPVPGDQRAWDGVIRIGRVRIGIEADTRATDGQELQRRLNLKRRDGGVDHVILVLSDTPSNRRFLRSWPEIRADLPGDGRSVMRALREGRDPGTSGIVLVPAATGKRAAA